MRVCLVGADPIGQRRSRPGRRGRALRGSGRHQRPGDLRPETDLDRGAGAARASQPGGEAGLRLVPLAERPRRLPLDEQRLGADERRAGADRRGCAARVGERPCRMERLRRGQAQLACASPGGRGVGRQLEVAGALSGERCERRGHLRAVGRARGVACGEEVASRLAGIAGPVRDPQVQVASLRLPEALGRDLAEERVTWRQSSCDRDRRSRREEGLRVGGVDEPGLCRARQEAEERERVSRFRRGAVDAGSERQRERFRRRPVTSELLEQERKPSGGGDDAIHGVVAERRPPLPHEAPCVLDRKRVELEESPRLRRRAP